MKPVFASIGLIFLAAPAFAGVCGADSDRDIPLFEEAKEAFLAAEYERFVEIAGPYFPDLKENFDDYFGQIQVVFPNGFDRCQTVLQRREAPGFHQDVIFYFPKGSKAPLALLMIAADVDGEARMIEFNYNTSISDVLSDLK